MSNWYRHAKVCLTKSIDKDKCHQPAIHSFFAMPKSTTDVCNSKEPTSVSAMVLDGTADHSINLTDCQGTSSDMAVAADKFPPFLMQTPVKTSRLFRNPYFPNWKEGLKMTLVIPNAHGL